jgi:hypothetical protein
MVWSQLIAFPAEAEDAKTQPLPRFSDYRLVDSELKFVGIDYDATESFLALQLDSAGRLFAGGREALFVYEPTGAGLYQPRQLLYRFPKDSWIYGIAIRGADLYVSTHTAVYVLEGAVLNRADIKPKRLLWGLPMLPYFESELIAPDPETSILGQNHRKPRSGPASSEGPVQPDFNGR